MKKTFSLLALCLISFSLFSQNKITYKGSGNYTLKERSDLRRYDNGKYTGLVRREVTSFITPVSFENGYQYEGNFFLQEDTLRANQEVGFGIRDSIPSAFKISNDGNLTMTEDNGFPTFRSFPTFTNKNIKLGDSWTGKAERAVDPLNKGIVTKMPIYVQYTYKSDEYYNDEPVFVLYAQWATRYGSGSGTSYIDWGGDKDLEKATGSHKANIYVSKITGNAVVVRDTVDETFYFADGNVIQFKGTISLFTEYPPAVDRNKLMPVLKRLCELSDKDAEELTSIPDTKTQLAMKYENVDEQLAMLDTKLNEILANPVSKTDETGSPATTETAETSVTTATSSVTKNSTTAAAETTSDNSELSELIEDQLKESLEKENALLTEKKQQLAALTEKVTKFMNNNKEEATNKNKIAVDSTPAGIRLSIQDLQFKANSSELLPGESSRLDQIAEVLKSVPEAQLLVEGHTASTGNIKGEKQLSVERAQEIAKALSKRGVAPGRFICKGFGGTKPVADNSTAAGKARNRRVEITILD